MTKLSTLGLFALLAAAASGQTAPDPQTRRIEDLENRVRQLEQQLKELLAAKAEVAPRLAETRAAPEPAPPAPPAPGLETETRLPVSGYMDFHFNKPQGEPAQLDFHRFVLLFGHSFSNRIKFWSEVELEHAFVEGREEKGELELEQAYLDFLVKPYFNFRGGDRKSVV